MRVPYSHGAVYRKGLTLYLAFDGIIRGVQPNVPTNFTGNDLFMGLYYSNGYCGKGKQDEYRVIKGSTPYDHKPFTPPAGPFTL